VESRLIAGFANSLGINFYNYYSIFCFCSNRDSLLEF